MTTHPVPFGTAVAITVAGAVTSLVATVALRSRTLASLALALGSHERAEWAYAVTYWLLAALLAFAYRSFDLIPARLDVALAGGSALVVLGVVWPSYMQDAGFTSTQRLVQRGVAIIVGVILFALGAGHTG